MLVLFLDLRCFNPRRSTKENLPQTLQYAGCLASTVVIGGVRPSCVTTSNDADSLKHIIIIYDLVPQADLVNPHLGQVMRGVPIEGSNL
jgi:hypothetical protein